MKVLFNPSEFFQRYNGGWTKEVTGLDKTKTNGYSILGEFTETKKRDWYHTEKLYLDCGIGGSRRNPIKDYTLFRVVDEDNIDIIFETESRDWATLMWKQIEENLQPSTDLPQSLQELLDLVRENTTAKPGKEKLVDSCHNQIRSLLRIHKIGSFIRDEF